MTYDSFAFSSRSSEDRKTVLVSKWPCRLSLSFSGAFLATSRITTNYISFLRLRNNNSTSSITMTSLQHLSPIAGIIWVLWFHTIRFIPPCTCRGVQFVLTHFLPCTCRGVQFVPISYPLLIYFRITTVYHIFQGWHFRITTIYRIGHRWYFRISRTICVTFTMSVNPQTKIANNFKVTSFTTSMGQSTIPITFDRL
jgi:hypothetical protein